MPHQATLSFDMPSTDNNNCIHLAETQHIGCLKPFNINQETSHKFLLTNFSNKDSQLKRENTSIYHFMLLDSKSFNTHTSTYIWEKWGHICVSWSYLLFKNLS